MNASESEWVFTILKVQASANDSEVLFWEDFPFSTSLGSCLRRHRPSLFDLGKEVKLMSVDFSEVRVLCVESQV